MREIKFRGWDGEKKKMTQDPFIYGDETMGREWDQVSLNKGLQEYQEYRGKTSVLMQYTGIKDKHGNEIYEGDVFCLPDVITGAEGLRPGFIFSKEDKFVVEWDSEWHAWSFNRTGNLNDLAENTYINQVRVMMTDGSCQVIGNIYENPELITG